jgi:DNA repair exonuclease SbcCD ATPase subunit
MNERALADLQQLANRDAELAGRAELIRDLDARVAELRQRAESIDAFFADYPDAEARLRAAVSAARGELERRREELASAERGLTSAQDEESRERAQHELERADDHVRVAVAALDRAKDAAEELERRAAALPEELPRLETAAREIAARFAGLPAPPPGPRDLVEWTSQAHAELFVGAGDVATQRERVIREANELATMLLGEPTYGSTIDQVLARVIAICARG